MPTPDAIEFAAYNLRANRSPPLIFSGIYVHYLTVSGRSSSRGGRNLNFSPVWLHNLSIGCCQPLCGLSDCLGSGQASLNSGCTNLFPILRILRVQNSQF